MAAPGTLSVKSVLYIVEERCHIVWVLFGCVWTLTHGHCSAGKQSGKVTHLCKKCLNSNAVCSIKSIVFVWDKAGGFILYNRQKFRKKYSSRYSHRCIYLFFFKIYNLNIKYAKVSACLVHNCEYNCETVVILGI